MKGAPPGLVVSQFNSATKIIMLKNFIIWPSPTVLERFVHDFQNLHQILYVVGAVDGSHIPIVAPQLHVVDYYNR